MVIYSLLLFAMFILDALKLDVRILIPLVILMLLFYRSKYQLKSRLFGFVFMFSEQAHHILDYFMCFVMLTFVYYNMGWLMDLQTFISYPFNFIFFYFYIFRGNTKKILDD
ncbi:hypothetical protein [Erysipelothrix urinaevulpis]|nr:hypothetical protein [Erysipelothrix urinaevulpis]